MLVLRSKQFLVVFALCLAQVMQMHGENADATRTKYDYEMLRLEEYSSLMEKREIVQRKVIFNCAFENGWCGFRNDKQGDDFDWTWTNKRTPSRGTGPEHDITGRGAYIFIEASSPRRIANTARLISFVFPPMVYCLQFGFHAWGPNVGKLVVYKKDVDNNRERILTLQDKNYGKTWYIVSTTVAHHSQFVIEFEGVCGNGYRGDISLDNITLTEGKCHFLQRNSTDSCGYGYPGYTNTIPGYPAYHAWPWLVWLSRNSPSSCSGVYVSSKWLLTTRQCTRKFKNDNVAIYAVKKKKRRNVLKRDERFTYTQQEIPALVKLNSSQSDSIRMREKLCLPPSISLQNRVSDCFLLGLLSTNGNKNSFVELPATILSTKECRQNVQANTKKSPNLIGQLCAQVNRSLSFNNSRLQYGYLVCKNKVIDSWILQGMGSFSKSHFMQKILVLRRVSFDVDWIENVTKVPFQVPDHSMLAIPKIVRSAKGFQIMETRNQECLTFVLSQQKFIFAPCNEFEIAQRFDWTRDFQLVTVHANLCLESDGTHLHILRGNRCTLGRRSQIWVCERNAIMSLFYHIYISFKTDKNSDFAKLTRIRAEVGNLVISGTHDNLCSLRPTVKGVMKCDFNRHRMCKFDGVESSAQFMWRVPRTGSKDFMDFPPLTAKDKFFKVIRRTGRGTPIAVLRSQPFHGQHCAEFYLVFRGSSLNQLNVYKDGGGEGKRMFQRNATSDNYWRLHRVTIVPDACEAFQIVFEAVFPDFTKSKVAIRDIVIVPGSCRARNKRTDGECLKGWKLFRGRCVYFDNTKATWHEASAVCRIVGAELVNHGAAANGIIPRGLPTWFGVRSCPTGRLYSVQGVPYNSTKLFAKPACVQVEKSSNKTTVYRTMPCDLKLPFACQKEPRTIKGTCGWRDLSARNDRQWPWHVLIVVGEKCVCGGTLIAPGYVATSTLCLSRVWKWRVKLFFPSSRSMIRKVTEIINHSMSGRKSGDNDISIVVFEDDPSLHFACLMQISPRWTDNGDSLLKGKRCIVLGWGTFKGSFRMCESKNYEAHEVEVVNTKECSEYYGAHMTTERMICAKSRNDTCQKCLGDTGGPLVCEIAGAWTLVGVTSWGIGCTYTRKYGIYTDVGSMKPWLDLVMRENQYL